ncbi:MAG: SDR family NAD(P)-dependent oxidoreductase, partial [Myxococcota bacterium]|nr:SDR family NAD(P)-dependent oxidoreductase [Myxococcota bacterium]
MALVTGASRGIGAAVATRLAREGCHVALLARTEASLKQVEQDCQSHGVRALSVPCDVLEPDSLSDAVDRVV